MASTPEKVGLFFAGQELQLEYGFASSIDKDFNRLEDGTVLSEKHTMTIRGAFSAVGYEVQDRYENLLTKSAEYADYKAIGVIERLVSLQAGPLELYKMQQVGDVFRAVGQPILRYSYAQLMSVGVSEPPEDTAGLHFQEVTFVFESITPPTDTIGSKYRLKTASEQYEIKKEEDKMSFFVMKLDENAIIKDVEDDPYYSYSITHTLSAEGQNIFYNTQRADYNNYENSAKPSNPNSSSHINNQKYEAFYEAYKYVNEKKHDSLVGIRINKDVFGRPFVGSNEFIPVGWEVSNASGQALPILVGADDDPDDIAPEKIAASGMLSNALWSAVSGKIHQDGKNPLGGYGQNKYGEYNIIRSSSVDLLGGSYSITTNYYYSRNPATIEINGVFEKGEDGNDVVRIEGTIQGHDSLGVKSDRHNKFKNARMFFKNLISSGVFKTSTPNGQTYRKTETNQINNPETYAEIQKYVTYPSSVYGTNTSGNVLTKMMGKNASVGMGGPAFTEPFGNAGLHNPWDVKSNEYVIKPWAYGTMIYAFANETFENNAYASFYQVGNVLDFKPMSTSTTENKIAGTIQFSATYKGIPETVRNLTTAMGALSVTISEQQDNCVISTSDGSDQADAIIQTQHVVPVMILGKKSGPIIQNMGTTKESKRTIQIEAVYGAEHRHPATPVIAKALNVASVFLPSGDYAAGLKLESYLTDLNYQWDWAAGKLTISAGWMFTKVGYENL